MKRSQANSALTFLVLAFAGAARAEDIHHKLAVTSAIAVGYQYQNGVFCHAPDDLLRALKEKAATKYAAAGVDFEPAFARGREEASRIVKHAMTVGMGVPVSEDALRKSLCIDGHLVEQMREELAKP